MTGVVDDDDIDFGVSDGDDNYDSGIDDDDDDFGGDNNVSGVKDDDDEDPFIYLFIFSLLMLIY